MSERSLTRMVLALLVSLSAACASPVAPSAPVNLHTVGLPPVSAPPVVAMRGQFTVDGNSLTQSRNGAIAMQANVLTLLGAPGTVTFSDEAESGIGMAQMLLPDHLARVDATCHPGAPNVLLYWEGVHDLVEGHSADETADRLEAYGRARKAAGFTVVTLTMLPAAAEGFPADYEASRQRVNQRLRTDARDFADTLVDIGADPLMGDASAATAGIYISPIDRVHLTDAGSLRVANLVAPIVRGFLEGK